MDTIGKRLKYLRNKINITQKELSDSTGIKRATLSHYEKDDYKPSSEASISLAKFFNVSVDWLINGDDAESQAFEEKTPYIIRKKVKELGPLKHNDGSKVNSRDKRKIIELLDGTLGDLMYNQKDVYEEFTDEDLKLIEDALVSTFLDIRDIKRKERLKKAKQEKDHLEAEIKKLEKELENDSKDNNTKGD